MRSAFFPASSEPMSASMCRARAPPIVAISTASRAVKAAASPVVIFCSLSAVSISSNMLKSLLLAGPSVPRPTRRPALRSFGMGATPAAIFMLLCGQWASPASRAFTMAMSSSESHTAWARSVRGPRIPSPSRWAIEERE